MVTWYVITIGFRCYGDVVSCVVCFHGDAAYMICWPAPMHGLFAPWIWMI